MAERAQHHGQCRSLLGDIATAHRGVRAALEAVAESDPDDEVRWRAGKAVGELPISREERTH